MRSITKNAVEFLKRKDGPTTITHAVLMALVVVVSAAAVIAIGSASNYTFTTSGSSTMPN